MPLRDDWVDGQEYTPADQNAVAAAVNILALQFDVREYGATGDGTTNDTTAFATAIAAAAAANAAVAGGDMMITVRVPSGNYRTSNLTIPGGVILDCDGAQFYPVSGMTGTLMTFSGTASGIRNATLNGFGITNASAITFDNTCWGSLVVDCRIVNWESRAILDYGVSTKITRVYAAGLNSASLTNALTAYTGVVELRGSDATITDSEFNASRNQGSINQASTSGKACALAIMSDGSTYFGANNMVVNTVCEQADIGVYTSTSTSNHDFVGLRGELCWHHGFLFEGGNGRLTACQAMWNSKSTDNTWDGFNFASGTVFVATNCTSHDVFGPSNKHRYAFNDAGAPSLNKFVNCASITAVGQAGDHAVWGGSAVDSTRAPRVQSIASSATPTINTNAVDQFNITAQAAAITSMTTNLSGSNTDGQLLDIRIKDNGTARAITWGASFTGTLLTTTVINKTHLQRLKWDATASKWAGYLADTAGY